jgi:aarF domain-containing kinase
MEILFYYYANSLDNGREVAIKVQKREIANQVGWDLWAFKLVRNSLPLPFPGSYHYLLLPTKGLRLTLFSGL